MQNLKIGVSALALLVLTAITIAIANPSGHNGQQNPLPQIPKTWDDQAMATRCRSPMAQRDSHVASGEVRRHNLPAQLTSFIGRTKEIAETRGLMSTTRLLTLTGAGGCGKPRLALQVASEMLDQFRDPGSEPAWLQPAHHRRVRSMHPGCG